MTALLSLLLAASLTGAQLPQRGLPPPQAPFLKRDRSSRVLFAKILEAEDKRQSSKFLLELIGYRAENPDAEFAERVSHLGVRRRAALALGRIGDPADVVPLVFVLKKETSPELRADLIFAIGEIEDEIGAVDELLRILGSADERPAVRARAAEALGKIGSYAKSSALLAPRRAQIAAAIAAALPPAAKSVGGDELLLAKLGITALLRLKDPSSLAPLIARLGSPVARIRADAANAIARIRPEASVATGAVAPLTALLADSDPVVRANASTALAAIKATDVVDTLVRLLGDADRRVVGSAIRALGGLGDPKAAAPLEALGRTLAAGYSSHTAAKRPGIPDEHGLLMLVATALGTLKEPSSLPFLQSIRSLDGAAGANPETEIAIAAYGEEPFFEIPESARLTGEWRHAANYAQGLGAVSGERATKELLDMLAGRRFGPLDAKTLPEVFAALATKKPADFEKILIDNLSSTDVVVRATVAGLIGEHYAPASEPAFTALETAWKAAAEDRDNDAKLAILDAIAKYKEKQRALELLSGALTDPDYIVRKRAAELLEGAGQGRFRTMVPPAKTPPRAPGYYTALEAATRRANPTATITTEKGEIQLELLRDEAPMNAQNFIDLAEKGYFDGIVFHRVVPNFVVQGGDPRGDGNGGPGYQIRDEINMVPYDRGMVGMALSGKDTGGSQFFFTHSPQPHLDGGYTVFGRITNGMDVVDRLMRGDKILKVKILDAR